MHPAGFELNHKNLRSSDYALFEFAFRYCEEFNVCGFLQADQILYVYFCIPRPDSDLILNDARKRHDLFPFTSSTIITEINISYINLKQTYTKL
jgi:hypothetical protein